MDCLMVCERNMPAFSLPDYAYALRRCPSGGEKGAARQQVPPNLFIVHKPRTCRHCGFSWTPIPSVWVLVILLPAAALFSAGGIIGLGLVPLYIREWLNDDLPIGFVRVAFLFVIIVGAAFSIGAGLTLFALSRRVWRSFKNRPRNAESKSDAASE